MSDTRDAGGAPTTDARPTVFSNAHRRAVLLSIADGGDEPIPLDALVTGSTPEQAAVALRRTHSPALEGHGVIRWDREEGTVAAGPAFDEIEPFVRLLDDGRERLPDGWRSGLGR